MIAETKACLTSKEWMKVKICFNCENCIESPREYKCGLNGKKVPCALAGCLLHKMLTLEEVLERNRSAKAGKPKEDAKPRSALPTNYKPATREPRRDYC